MNPKYVTGTLLFVFIIFPVFIVQFTLTDEKEEPSQYMFKVQIIQKLDESLEGKFQYFFVRLLDGEGPADEFVILIAYWTTRDQINMTLIEPNIEFWGMGSIMTPEVFYEDHYLFFGHPQLYTWQIKGRIFWPDQATELRLLYQAPLRALLTPVHVIFYPGQDGFTVSNYLAILAQAVVLFATLVLLIKKRTEKHRVLQLLLGYALFTMLFTIPLLSAL